MAEELDYMSDEFIKSCVNSSNTQPGLLRTHHEQRLLNLMKKKKKDLENKKKPAEILEEALKQPIIGTNKGFSMLEKMGFKTGMGLGKNNSGIREPIGISIKNNRMGLGHKTPSKPQKTENKLGQIKENDFRAFLSKKDQDKKIISDLRKSQKICKVLDLKSEKEFPEEPWFWLEEEILNSEEAENDSDKSKLSYLKKLEILTRYLRDTHFYCIWCKVQYKDEKDLQDCPGSTRDNH